VAKQKPAIQQYDAVVIGTGQAGPPLARRLAAAGMTVAVIERGAFGGTCVSTGCIPTKTLIRHRQRDSSPCRPRVRRETPRVISP
jgi:pyruvate/2-oxoglutarate dehydrogenase complex dihydrolipoamide dehydrogenase (E3) component